MTVIISPYLLGVKIVVDLSKESLGLLRTMMDIRLEPIMLEQC